jgi:hypothetical protein
MSFFDVVSRQGLTHEVEVNCRFCTKATELLTDLGDLALTSFFPTKSGAFAPRIPLTVRRCPNCGLVQLGENTNPDLMYREGYGYKSGTNEAMVAHLHDVVLRLGTPHIKNNDAVLDIGSNDGTLLALWVGHGLQRWGIDPIGENAPGATVERKFFAYEHARPKFKVITSLAMFYDLPRPLSFVMDVEKSLAEGGVWIVEVQYAPKLLEGYWDGICHEHLCYYGLRQIRAMAQQVGLRLQSFGQERPVGGERAKSVRAWRLDEGEHAPADRLPRQSVHQGRGRAQRREDRQGDAGDRHPDHLGGGSVGTPARSVPGPAVSLSRGTAEALRAVPRAGRQVHFSFACSH